MTPLKRSLLILSRFSPRGRAAMVLTLDLTLCILSVLLAYSLRTGEWRVFRPFVLKLIVITCILWVTVALMQGVYRSVLRFAGSESIRDLGTSCGIIALLLIAPLMMFHTFEHAPRTLAVLIPLVLFLMLATSRIVLSALLRDILYSRRRSGRRHVLIYGAGVAGRELTLSIKDDPEFEVIGFIDDKGVLAGRRLNGRKIWHSSRLASVLETHSVDEVLLAIPTARRSRRRLIIDEVRRLAPGVGVRSVPNLSEIASGKVSVGDLREIQIEELLGRDQVTPDPRLMSANIRGHSVMVTGAGGSIGSELCRQILLQRPSQIILAERSELALYLIDGELRELCVRHKLKVEIEPKLVDVADRLDLERVFRECHPKTVFHAAAYKHVPLVETDPIAGIRNNVLGTYNCCVLAEEFGVENFTLVSTDKAVRPSSIMGASKRVCELVVLSRAGAQNGTRYSAVRFGNVLGSSGSVVPLFRRQIAGGGPVTITHRDATRYFMTVPEAAQLVVQAGAMAQGGEIFLLDMGEPVRIHELAKMMIQLSGLAPPSDAGDDGDIEIVEIGLRPGEKLHEELLIDNQALSTSHPRIVRSSEKGLAASKFESLFGQLLRSVEKREVESSLMLVHQMVGPAKSDEVIAVEGRAGVRSGARGKSTSMTSRGANKRRTNVSGKPAFGA